MGYTEVQFFEKIKPYVIMDMQKSGILASLTAAQASLESNKGNSGLTQKANNLFGIKGKFNGQSVNMLTTEVRNGVRVKEYADFRKYPSWLESINDHSDFLRKYKRYASIIGEKNYVLACQKMSLSGYATAPAREYCDSLINIINRNKLYEWDNYKGPVEIPASDEYIVGQTYTLQTDMYVRKTPNGVNVEFDDLTENAKLNGYEDTSGFGILKRGTRVTCKEVVNLPKSTWIKIPSGYICAQNSKTKYVL